jgi:hypothetical protein
VHTLDTIPKSWYIELEANRGTRDWEDLTRNFKVTFNFESNNPLAESTLKVLRNNIFSSKDMLGSLPLHSVARVTMTIEEVLHYYNVAEESQDEEDPINFQIS